MPPADARSGRELVVSLGQRSHEIHVVTRPFEGLDRLLAPWRGGKAAIVTDRHVDGLYGAVAVDAARAAGLEPVCTVVPAGEGSKSMGCLEGVLDDLIGAEVGRGDVVLALGGGVVGDLAGLAASLLRRGLPVVQVPTSLVAQVDSAVGGKTAINTPRGKNLVGTYHQPAAVLAATGCLGTLPDREIRAGLGEVVKYALLSGEAFLERLERETSSLLGAEPDAYVEVVYRCLAHKAALVERDERDGGVRRQLNLGHTLGHALESASGGRLRHGEAIAIGIVGALELSARWCDLPAHAIARARTALERLGLPVRSPAVSRRTVLDTLVQDKKRTGGELVWVVLRGIGAPEYRSVPPRDLPDILDELADLGVLRWETP